MSQIAQITNTSRSLCAIQLLVKMQAFVLMLAISSTFSGSASAQSQPPSPTKTILSPMPVPVISVAPAVFKVPGRQVDMQVKISAPVQGDNLPVILLSHGHGFSTYLSSHRGLAPLTEFFTSRGFVVIQPTHLDSKTLYLDRNGPEGPTFWKARASDMHFILDNLKKIIAVISGLDKRVDINQVSAIGHSLGGLTVAMLAGMEITDQNTKEIVNAAQPRLKARIIIGAPGSPDGITGQFAKERYPFLRGINYSTMNLPALVVNGDKDKNVNFSDREDWRADAYNDSPGPKNLLTVFGAEHIYGHFRLRCC